MAARPIRTNRSPLPAAIGRRDRPPLTPATLRPRAAGFRTLEAAVRRPGPATPRIVSSAHGPLRHLLLCYPRYADGELSLRPAYADLLRKLPASSRFTIVSHPDVIDDLQALVDEAGAGGRTDIVEAPDFLEFLVWAEDPYVAVHDVDADPPVVYLVEPFTFRRSGDAVLADLVADAGAVQSFQSPLYFQGGNVLVGDDFVLIGADYPALSLELAQSGSPPFSIPPEADPADFVRGLYRATFDPRREVAYVGTTRPVPQEERRSVTIDGQRWTEEVYVGTGAAQPIFHIDMFVTLAGRGPSGRYRLIVGSPQAADEILRRGTVRHSMPEIFDDVARRLRRGGFEVIRNPMPLTYVDDTETRVRTWYFATANNCLVQIDDDAGSAVWLPTYGHGDWEDLAPIDAANRMLWERLGFTVTELADFHPFAQRLGAVHCIKKYLER
ncbi:MAG: hypothetical protein ACRDJ4_00650 [Actinomycetota bacterium]